MSGRRLRKNILPPVTSSGETLVWKPIVLSDSKGRYLKLCTDFSVQPEKYILWLYKSGASSEERYQRLNGIIEKQLKRWRRVALIIFTGTCDLTNKQGRFINLRPDDPVASLKGTYLQRNSPKSSLESGIQKDLKF